MEFHLDPMKLQGLHWIADDCIGFKCIVRDCMGFQGISWDCIEITWDCKGLKSFAWYREFHRVASRLNGIIKDLTGLNAIA